MDDEGFQPPAPLQPEHLRQLLQFHERSLRELHKKLRGTEHTDVRLATLEAADTCYAAYRALLPPRTRPVDPGSLTA